MRKQARKEAQRALLDVLGRSNENKRGPKPKAEQVIVPEQHTSRLKQGVTVAYKSNVITLPDGTQCREGSLTHINFINNN